MKIRTEPPAPITFLGDLDPGTVFKFIDTKDGVREGLWMVTREHREIRLTDGLTYDVSSNPQVQIVDCELVLL